MRKCIIIFIIAVCLPVLSWAQGYFSATPVDNGSYDVPKELAGTWMVEKYKASGQVYSVFIDHNKTGQVSIRKGLGEITPAIISSVNNRLYLNILEHGGKEQPEGFYIFLLEIKDNKHIRLSPLKYDIALKGKTLYDYLDQPSLKTGEITAGYPIWLSNKHTPLQKPLDTTGRRINVKRK